MILVDTCVLVFDSLQPERLSQKAQAALDEAEERSALFCCDISLWEIAMLVAKGRLDPGTDSLSYIDLALTARQIIVLPIIPAIAHLSVAMTKWNHYDPADRIIAATARHHHARLVTSDKRLLQLQGIETIW
ncbi:MAG: type II toxin-antitoxin system VapC family toxin [Thermodesulfobacteriota bacterium]